MKKAIALALAIAFSPPAIAGGFLEGATPGVVTPIGPKGDRGCAVLPTAGAPPNVYGSNCDFAFDPLNGKVYGPKVGGVWPPPVTLGPVVGAQAAASAAQDYRNAAGASASSANAAATAANASATAAAAAKISAEQAAAAALANFAPQAHQWVRGRDGTGWLMSRPQADDVATTPIVGGPERTLADKAAEMRTPEDYGFVGDGVTDNAAAMARLAADPSGPTVVFPPKRYRLSCSTYSFASGVRLMSYMTPAEIFFDPGCVFAGDIFQWYNRSGGGVVGLTINLNTPTVAPAAGGDPPRKISALVVKAYGADVDGFVVSRTRIVNGVDQMALVNGGAHTGSLKNYRVENSYLHQTPGTIWNQCVSMSTNNGAGAIPRAVVDGNECNGSGIQLDGDGAVARYNDVHHFQFGAGIFAAYGLSPATQASARNCDISHNSIHDTGAGIDSNLVAHLGIENSCLNAKIAHNRIWSVGGSGITNFANRAVIEANFIRGVGKGLDAADNNRTAFGVLRGGVGTQETTSDFVTLRGNIAEDDGSGSQKFALFVGSDVSGVVDGGDNEFGGAVQAIKGGAAADIRPSVARTFRRQAALSSTTSALAFTGLDTASFRSWRLSCRNLTPSVADTPQVQVSADNGATWRTATSYVSQGDDTLNGTRTAFVNTTATGLKIGAGAWDQNQANPGQFEAETGDLAYAVGYKTFRFRAAYKPSAGGASTASGSGYWAGTTDPINALRVNMNGGATFYGSCALEGRP